MNIRQAVNIDEFSIELKLLLALVSNQHDAKSNDLSFQIKKSNINWDYFLQLMHHHRVSSLVFKGIKNKELGWIPQTVIEQIHRAYTVNTFKMLKLTSEMNYVAQLFEMNDLPAIMLKGPILSEYLYGDLSMRTSKDLDILIPLADVEKAEQILLTEGYICTENMPRILSDWQWRNHHISYFHPLKEQQIEIHWRLNPNTIKESSFNELWERRQTKTLSQGFNLNFLGSEDLLTYLIAHGARHGWFRLRWLTDIDKFLQEKMNYSLLNKFVSVKNIEAITGQTLILTKYLFGTKIDDEIAHLMDGKKPQKLARKTMQFIAEIVELCPVPKTKEMKKEFRKYMFNINSISESTYSVFSRFRPSSYDAQQLPLPRKLHFLYYVLRPFLWIIRKKKQKMI